MRDGCGRESQALDELCVASGSSVQHRAGSPASAKTRCCLQPSGKTDPPSDERDT